MLKQRGGNTMKHKVYRLFLSYEKEEAWLNKMAAKGLHCVDFFFGRYLFEKGSPGAYVYRIELLQYMPGHPEGAAYLEFLAESGIEVVASSLRWVYLRKKREDGPFDLFSDKASRLAHYKRVLQLLGVIAGINLLTGAIHFAPLDEKIYFTGIPNFVVFAILAIPLIGYGRRYYKLKKESRIRE